MKHKILDKLPDDARPVPGVDELYATPAGTLISTRRGKPRIRTPYRFRGHHRINIRGRRESLRVAQLIALTFHGPRPSLKHSAIHRTPNRLDNSAPNVMWGTSTQKAKLMMALGTQAKGEKHPAHVLTEVEVIKIRKLHREGFSRKELAAMFGVCKGTIGHIVTGKTWKHV